MSTEVAAESIADTAADAESGAAAPPRRRWLRRVVIAIVTVVGLGVVSVWVLLGSPWLHTTAVVISGSTPALEGLVEQAADVPLGGPLATVDTAAVAGRVGALPEVKSVVVTRQWPDTVAVTVTPRTPVAYVAGGAGGDLVDDTGRTFAAVAEPPVDLPQLTSTADALPRAAAVAAALPPAARAMIASIADAPDGVRLTLRDEAGMVLWGDSERSDEKGRILGVLLRAAGVATATDPAAATDDDEQQADMPTPTWFDVSVPSAPVTALGEPQRATSAEIRAAQEKQLAQLQQDEATATDQPTAGSPVENSADESG